MNLATNDENMNNCIRECNELILSTILQEFKSRTAARSQDPPPPVSHDGALLADIGDKLERLCNKLDKFTTDYDARLTTLEKNTTDYDARLTALEKNT